MTRFVKSLLGAAATTAALAIGGGQAFAQKEVVFGLQCDRTGPTENVGTVLCPGYQDYIALVNSKGGVEGYKIKVLEIDNEYKVPPAIEAHERFKKEGAVLEGLYGTPQTAALNKKLEEDKILGTSPGFGTAAVGRRQALSLHLPDRGQLLVAGAAPRWPSPRRSWAATSRARRSPTSTTTTRRARSRWPSSRTSPRPRASRCAPSPFRRPGVEMGAQILDITGRFKPDFIISHLFGRAPSVSIKELKGKGFPLSKVVGLVWASSEADIIAAGGMGVAEGYNTIQFAGVGKDFPVIKDIEAMYKAQGKQPPKEMDSTVLYNRGVLIAALHVEAVRNAIKAKGGATPTSEEVKKGMESIKGFTLGGLVPPMEITAADHEGGGWVADLDRQGRQARADQGRGSRAIAR